MASYQDETGPLEIDRYGPLAVLDRLCDIMEEALDPGRDWYPEVADRLRHLDHAIRWEMERLRWEVTFARRCAATAAKTPKPVSRGRPRRGTRARMHDEPQTPYEAG